MSIQARSGGFFAVCIPTYSPECLSHHVDVTSASCGHCPAKNEGASSAGIFFPPKLCFLWRVCAHVGIEFQAFVHERLELFPLERCTWSRLRIWKCLFLEKGLVCFHEEGLKNKSVKSPFFSPDQSSHHYERSFLIASLCHVMLIPLSPLWQGKRCIINLQISKVDVIFIQRRRSLTAEAFVWAWPCLDGTSLEHPSPSSSSVCPSGDTH